MEREACSLRKLFLTTFCMSMFTFGGGYVIIALMKKKFVDELKWLDEKEMLDITAIAQSSPGAVAVNASVFIGYRMAGIAGLFVAILGTVLPPLVILSVLSVFYSAFRDSPVAGAMLKGAQSGIAAVVTDVAFSLGKSACSSAQSKVFSFALMAVVFTAVFFFKVNVFFIIIVCGALGIACSHICKGKENRPGKP